MPGTTRCRSWWADVGRTTSGSRPSGLTCTWTITSRPSGWPSTCTDWTRTTDCTTNTSGGRAPVNSSTQSSSVGSVPCFTTTRRRPSTTGTWTTGGVARAYATTPPRGVGSSKRLPRHPPPKGIPRRTTAVAASSVGRPRPLWHWALSPPAATVELVNPASRTNRSWTSGNRAAPRTHGCWRRETLPPPERAHGGSCRPSGQPTDASNGQLQYRRRRLTCACPALPEDVVGAVGRTYATSPSQAGRASD